MARLLLLTNALAPSTEVLPALGLLGHAVRVLPAEPAVMVDAPEHDVLLVDARRELAQARALCRMIRATGTLAPLVAVLTDIYRDAEQHWDVYEACEELVDLEDNFQLWRFRHMRTVMRIIGFKRGTGGSSGVGFLQRALDLTFFPELFSVRTEV